MVGQAPREPQRTLAWGLKPGRVLPRKCSPPSSVPSTGGTSRYGCCGVAWRSPSATGPAAIDAAHHQLSLFNWAASSYREELGNDLAWTSHSTPLSSALAKMNKNDPLLREMPLALMDARVEAPL